MKRSVPISGIERLFDRFPIPIIIPKSPKTEINILKPSSLSFFHHPRHHYYHSQRRQIVIYIFCGRTTKRGRGYNHLNH